MTNEQILKKAIEKAVKNGYKTDWYDEKHDIWLKDEAYGDVWNHYEESPQIIFSHDFAKAFWGDKLIGKGWIAWKYHLREAVCEKEPIKYLEKFI